MNWLEFKLTRLATIIKNCGLYRDNGFVIMRNVNGQQIDRERKNIIKIYLKMLDLTLT